MVWVSGPVTCSLWTIPRLGKKVLLLGDYHHSRAYGCGEAGVPVADFLEDLALKHEVDVFLEQVPDDGSRISAAMAWLRRTLGRRDPHGEKRPPLEAAVARFRRYGCLDRNHASTCDFRGRVHDVDPRWSSAQSQPWSIESFEELAWRWLSATRRRRVTASAPEARALLAWLKRFGRYRLLAATIRAYWASGGDKTAKQISAVRDARVRGRLERMLALPGDDAAYDAAMAALVRIVRAGRSPDVREDKELGRGAAFGEAFDALITATLPIMDMYALGRMFRDFNDPSTPGVARAVVYAGDAHIQVYERFLRSVGGKRHGPQATKSMRCVRVPLREFLTQR